jgi:hypothetical protein
MDAVASKLLRCVLNLGDRESPLPEVILLGGM